MADKEIISRNIGYLIRQLADSGWTVEVDFQNGFLWVVDGELNNARTAHFNNWEQEYNAVQDWVTANVNP